MKKLLLASLFLLYLTSCGYRFDSGDKISVSVPYILGENEGELTDALASALSHTPQFRYTHSGGDWIIRAKIKGTKDDRIGFRYDRDDKSGKLRDNVIGTENRREISVEVSIEDGYTGELVMGPVIVKATSDYDYVNAHSLQDLSFIDSSGMRDTSIAFSMGQLDSVGAAGRDSIYPIYRKLAKKIVDGMIASGFDAGE